MNAKFLIFSLLLSCAGTVMAVDLKVGGTSTVVAHDVKGDFEKASDFKVGAGEGTKVFVVDIFQVMRESEEGKEIADKIEKQRAEIAKQLEADGKKLEAADKEIRAKMSTMSKEALNKEELRLTKMKRDLENKVRDGEETLKLAMQQATEKLAHKVEATIDSYVKKFGKDIIIIDKSTGRVVYASEKADITSTITRQMDAEYAAAKAKTKDGGAAATVGAKATPAA